MAATESLKLDACKLKPATDNMRLSSDTPKQAANKTKPDPEKSKQTRDNMRKSEPASGEKDSMIIDDLLKAQSENFEKQVAEFKEMARSVEQTTLEHSKPLSNTLKELTEQVSAIRQYATLQQDKMEKLQDGYDWNIVRTFCLRIIRCIDNLESRMERLSKQGTKTANLEEIRDELIFALESSGVEQFTPEIDSDYRGQERSAEAVKAKEKSDKPKMTGKIAKVVRPGYRYIIDEENWKVVRTAQVKLYQ